jgi:hypothetical protein
LGSGDLILAQGVYEMASSTPVPVFDATRYPCSYAPSLGNQVLWISFGSLLAGAGIWGIWYSLVAGDQLGPKGPPLASSLSLVLVLLGGYLILSMLFSKVILRPDAVEVRNLLSRQTMFRQEIMGRRFVFNTGTIEFIPRDSYKKKLKIAFLTNPDALFTAWFESIPDLDAEESTKVHAE